MDAYSPTFGIDAVGYAYYIIHSQHDYDDGGVDVVVAVTQSGTPAIDPQDIVDYVKTLLGGTPDLLSPVATRLQLGSTSV